MTNTPAPKLHSIQCLRCVAVMMVVWVHAREQLPWVAEVFASDAGANGVDLFFVISGFIMVHTTWERDTPPAEFLLRRAVRIVPLYWLVTGLIAVAALVAPWALKSTVVEPAHLVASLLFVPWPSPVFPAQLWPLVIPGWSINYEVFFYLLFGVMLFFPRRWRIALLAAVMLALVVVLHGARHPLLAFYGNPVMLEFVCGALVGWFHAKGYAPRRLAVGLAWAGLGVAYWLWALDAGLPNRLLAAGLPATLIVWGLAGLSGHQPVVLRWAYQVGNASYSIYLFHVIVLGVIRALWTRGALPAGGDAAACLFMAVALAANVLAGLALYRWLELPLSAWGQALVQRRSGWTLRRA